MEPLFLFGCCGFFLWFVEFVKQWIDHTKHGKQWIWGDDILHEFFSQTKTHTSPQKHIQTPNQHSRAHTRTLSLLYNSLAVHVPPAKFVRCAVMPLCTWKRIRTNLEILTVRAKYHGPIYIQTTWCIRRTSRGCRCGCFRWFFAKCIRWEI